MCRSEPLHVREGTFPSKGVTSGVPNDNGTDDAKGKDSFGCRRSRPAAKRSTRFPLFASDETNFAGGRRFERCPHEEPWTLRLISVVHRPVVHTSYGLGDVVEQAFRSDCQTAKRHLMEVATLFDGANVTIEQEVLEGPIGPSIVKDADRFEADLMVIGATGQSAIARVLLGSVSDHVATHAPCSVLVVRGESHPSQPRLRIGLAYEGSAAAEAALEEITEIPWGQRCDFELVSVADSLLIRYIEEAERWKYETHLQTAAEQIREACPFVHTHYLVAAHSGEALVNFAESKELDVMVIGESQRHAVSRMLLGSTSRFVLRHAPCSVWITRNRVSSQSNASQASKSATPVTT